MLIARCSVTINCVVCCVVYNAAQWYNSCILCLLFSVIFLCPCCLYNIIIHCMKTNILLQLKHTHTYTHVGKYKHEPMSIILLEAQMIRKSARHWISVTDKIIHFFTIRATFCMYCTHLYITLKSYAFSYKNIHLMFY